MNAKTYHSSICYCDSNSQPLDHESPPIITRPVVPTYEVHKHGSLH